MLRSASAKALRQHMLRRDSKNTCGSKVELVTNNKYNQSFPSEGMEAYQLDTHSDEFSLTLLVKANFASKW